MWTKEQIIADLATRRVAEEIIARILRRRSGRYPEDADLAQMVYLALLKLDEAKVSDLWEKRQMGFFIVAIVRNQVNSPRSNWHNAFHALLRRSEPIKEDGNDADDGNPAPGF